VARGGTIALDVAEALIQLSQAKSDGCSDKFLKANIRGAEAIVDKLQGKDEQLEAKIESADLRFTKLGRAFGTAQKQAECDLKAAGAKVQAAERRAASAAARIDNMVFYKRTLELAVTKERERAESAESRLNDVTMRVVAAGWKLPIRETTDTATRDRSDSRKRSERSALPRMHASELQKTEEQGVQGSKKEMEGGGLVAIVF
jgi:hypothetical protein